MARSVVTRYAALTAVGTIMALAPAYAQDTQDDAVEEQRSQGIEVMQVTAQRQEESLLDVPVAVTAFDASALDLKQIDNVSDLQFNTPNVTFTKGNFTGSNFQIRGIGSTLVATSADSGVGVHVNDVYLNQPRIFETEYFDIERVEVLRGPQGTLYGRNATGGTINVITARPVLDDFSAFIEGQLGNFDHRTVQGHVNVPIIEDVLGVRIAGIYNERDGYTENIFDGENIDGRDQYSIRGSVRFQPFESTTIDIIGSYFEEDSNRARITKQKCDRDPSGVLGCLPGKLDFEASNQKGTLAGLLGSNLILGPLGITDFFGPGGGANANNPNDLRQVNLDFNPIYEADETFVMAQVTQDLTEDLELIVVGAYQETSVLSQNDYNSQFLNDPAVVPDALAFAFPTVFQTYYADGLFPISSADENNVGIIGGNIADNLAFLEGYDQSSANGDQFSIEARVTSSYDGPLNFLLAAYYLEYTADGDYYVISNALDYFALVGAGVDGIALTTPFFNSDTNEFKLESYAVFGEVYYDVTDDFKLTAGLRYTVDNKFVRDRQTLLDAPVVIGTQNGNPTLAGVDKDPARDGEQTFREDEVEFDEFTGRFVAEWSPDFSFTDSTLIYASYSRGYKGGGINPPIDPTLFPDTEAFFEPEFINAIEIGTKNQLFDGRLQASLTGFYYDYSGLQVSKIVNRTSVNENIDATIWGLEAEFLAAPTPEWLLNLSVSYLNTEIGEASSVDGRDPTDGRDDVTLVKDIENASNCVIEHNGLPDPVTAGVDQAIAGAGIPYFAANTPGIASAAFSSCVGLEQFFGAAQLPYTVSSGVEADLEGNELQNSPNWTITAGAQHTYDFNAHGYDLSLVSRVDYYIQGDMFARIFNKPIDQIDSWDQVNASLTLYGPEEKWYVRGFVQNLLDSDNITGQYLTDASSGNFTNVFVLEPRLYGVTLGYNF